ncbi:protein of unknown function [Paraburkholderia kururiensis]
MSVESFAQRLLVLSGPYTIFPDSSNETLFIFTIKLQIPSVIP